MANNGVGRVGIRSYVATPQQITTSTLLTSLYSVWNADTLGTSLDTSIYGVYNGDNVNDTSGNARNGTNVGGVTFTTGKVGNAFTFNGSSNYVALPNSSFDFTGDFSISTWVKIPANPSGYCGIFSNYNYELGSNLGYLIQLSTDRKIAFGVHGTGGSSNVFSTTTVALNTWYHITVRRDSVAKRSELYINGVFEGEAINTNITIGYGTRAIQPTIGAIRTNDQGVLTTDRFLNGSVDALTIWNKKLTDNEITSLYNAGTGTEYPFSSQLLPSPNDAVSTNHGTLTNGTTFAAGKIGQAFTFDGINDYVALPNNIMKFSNTDNWSVSFWIYQTAGAYSGVIGNWDYIGGQSTGWGIRTGGTAGGDPSKFTIQLFTNFVNGSGNLLNPLQTLGTTSINTWNHFVITRNSSAQEKIYQNGILVASQTNPSTKLTYPATSYSCIGAERYQSGIVGYAKAGSKIDAMSVWNKELTSTEITELYNTGTGKQYPYVVGAPSSLLTNLYAIYKGENNANDLLGNFNGTAQGGLTYTTGKSGNAFTFNGSNAYVSLPTNQFKFTSDFSISTWVNLEYTDATQRMICNYFYDGTNEYGWWLQYTGVHMQFQFVNSTGSVISILYNYSGKNNAWHHVTITKKLNGSLKLYINGALETTNTTTDNPRYTTTHYPAIGVMQYNSTTFTGFTANGSKIDEVNIWNKELTATDVTTLYNSGTGKFYPTF
jgi:hypothetical protein